MKPKRAITTVSLDVEDIKLAKALGINVSATCRAALKHAVAVQGEGLAEWGSFVDQNGPVRY